MKKKITAAVLALLLLLSAASCSKNEGDTDKTDPSVQGEVIEKTNILTGIFKESDFEVPEEFEIPYNGKVYIDKDSGNVKILFNKYCYEEDENGVYISGGYKYKLCEYDSDLNLLSETDLDIPAEYIDTYIISKDSIFYLQSQYNESGRSNYYLSIYNLSDGTTTQSNDLGLLFDSAADSDWFYIQNICVDNDGYIYAAADGEIVVLDSAFTKQFSIPLTNWVNSMSAAANGDVYICTYFDSGMGVAKINKEKKALDEAIIPEGNFNDILFGDGYDLYLTTESGVYGCTFTENGLEREELMNYSNSDVSSNNFEVKAILNKDKILANDRDPVTYDSRIVLAKKSDDIDLSQIKVVEIATADYTDYELASQIVNYNKTHKDSRIILNDYTQYNTTENYDAGKTKLLSDVTNGLYKPDILIGGSYSGTASNFVENELFIDLNTFLASDNDIKSDDILDCVKRTFTTSDGKLWGLTSSFSVQTLVGKKSELGDKTSWSLEEMLDYAASLPDGVQLLDGITQLYMLNGIDGVFDTFIDFTNNTCNFENEAFYKYLNYLKTLPTDFNFERDYDNYYSQYQNGSVALYPSYLFSPVSFIELECVFNSDDYTLIGMPVSNETKKGGLLYYNSAYMITKYCENTNVAWDFIKSVVKPDTNNGSYGGFNILKSSVQASCEHYYDYEFEFYFSGGASYGPKDPENPMKQEDMYEPGIVSYFTEEDTTALLNYLNNECGAPLSSAMPADLSSIIIEEITSFTGGAKTAEDCARVIQSRVSIYLAEHE